MLEKGTTVSTDELKINTDKPSAELNNLESEPNERRNLANTEWHFNCCIEKASVDIYSGILKF